MIQVRPIRTEDQNFVYASWLNNFKDSPFARRITHSIYFDKQKRLIDQIMERPSTRTLIACNPEDPSSIFGYLVFEQQDDQVILHYAFVKAVYQKMGIFKTMMNAANIDQNGYTFTHWTAAADGFLTKHPGITYDPYRA